MSRQPGFVPIPFYVVGRILLTIGILGCALYGVSAIGNWISLPLIVLLFSLALILVGFYLIFVVPREPQE